MGQEQQDKTVKRYYWLKLKEDFFQDKEVKKLRKIAGGDTYTIIYLKLMLLSLKSDGLLYFDGIEDTFHEELALEIDEDAENVRVTLMYLERMGLLQLKDEDEMYLTQMDTLICSESESAQRVRRHRAKMKQIESEVDQDKLPASSKNTDIQGDSDNKTALQSNSVVTCGNADETNCNTYIDIEKDIKKDKKKDKKIKEPKHIYGTYSHVRLTDTEYQRLCNDYGEPAVKDGIENVDRYCQMKGKTYNDYNLVLRGWGIKSPKLAKPISKPVEPQEEEISEEELIKQLDAEGVKWIT